MAKRQIIEAGTTVWVLGGAYGNQRGTVVDFNAKRVGTRKGAKPYPAYLVKTDKGVRWACADLVTDTKPGRWSSLSGKAV